MFCAEEVLVSGFDLFDDDPDFLDFLKLLVEQDALSGASLGVTRQVIARGVESLSPAQRFVLEKYVVKAHAIEHCARCSSSVPWSEMIEAVDNGGYCGYCAHMMEKITSE